MFEYALPLELANKPDDKKGGGDDKGKKKPDEPKPVQTQMIGEKPGDDLGYDPKKIPVEEIPDD